MAEITAYKQYTTEFTDAESWIESILDSEKLDDTSFVDSVKKQMEEKLFITPKQIKALENIMTSFRIEA